MAGSNNLSGVIVCDDHYVSALGIFSLLKGVGPNGPEFERGRNGFSGLEEKRN